MIGEEANAPEIVVPNSSGGDGIGTDGIGRERNGGEGKGHQICNGWEGIGRERIGWDGRRAERKRKGFTKFSKEWNGSVQLGVASNRGDLSRKDLKGLYQISAVGTGEQTSGNVWNRMDRIRAEMLQYQFSQERNGMEKSGLDRRRTERRCCSTKFQRIGSAWNGCEWKRVEEKRLDLRANKRAA